MHWAAGRPPPAGTDEVEEETDQTVGSVHHPQSEGDEGTGPAVEEVVHQNRLEMGYELEHPPALPRGRAKAMGHPPPAEAVGVESHRLLTAPDPAGHLDAEDEHQPHLAGQRLVEDDDRRDEGRVDPH